MSPTTNRIQAMFVEIPAMPPKPNAQLQLAWPKCGLGTGKDRDHIESLGAPMFRGR